MLAAIESVAMEEMDPTTGHNADGDGGISAHEQALSQPEIGRAVDKHSLDGQPRSGLNATTATGAGQ